MDPLEWHNRLIQRMIARDPNVTIKQYLSITDPYEPILDHSKEALACAAQVRIMRKHPKGREDEEVKDGMDLREL